MADAIAKGRLEVLQIYRLLQSVREGDKPYIEKLTSKGVDDIINHTEPREGTGVLHLASLANNADMVEFLMARGARPDVQDRRGRTALMLAAELGYDGIVALLANQSADLSVVDEEGKGLLFYCIHPTKRHVRCLQTALSGNSDVNNVSRSGMPVFMLACEQARECEGMCLSILNRGANPNATNQLTGRSALMEATRAGAVDLVRAILQKGANVNALDKMRCHAAHFAAKFGFLEIIKVLSAYAADFTAVTVKGESPLHFAASGGHTDCCRFLAQRGSNPKLKNRSGLLARQVASSCGYKAAVKELKKAERQHGKIAVGMGGTSEPWALTLHDWSHENESALRSAIQLASSSSSERVSKKIFVSILQKLQAPVNDNQTEALLLALDKRNEGFVNVGEFIRGVLYLPGTYVLSSYGPKKKKASKGGKAKKIKLNIPMPIYTHPFEAIPRREDGGPPYFMIESYQHATDTHRFDRDNRPKHPLEDDTAWYIEEPEKVFTNINYCVKAGDMESVRLALKQKVPIDVKDQFYKTPLMAACTSGSYDMAKILLNNGADVNACDQFCWTPLHHACHAGQPDIVKLLLESGASVDVSSLNGGTPLMRAIESGVPACVEHIIRAGAKVTAETKTGQNCLDVARTYGDIRVVEMVQKRMDSMQKPTDLKKQSVKGQSKPTSIASSTKEKAALVTNAEVQTAVKKEDVIAHSSQITNGLLNQVDISFVPTTTWNNQMTTTELMESKAKRRQRLGFEVDFDDLSMPFNKNIQKMSVELGLPE